MVNMSGASEEERGTVTERAAPAIAAFSLLAALTPLIPVPLLDDFVADYLHRAMSNAIFAADDVKLPREGAGVLTDAPSSLFTGLLRKISMAPIKWALSKVMSKVLFVKGLSDMASTFLHEGLLLAWALEAGHVEREAVERGDFASLERVRKAVLATCGQIETSPIHALVNDLFKTRWSDIRAGSVGLVSYAQGLMASKEGADSPAGEPTVEGDHGAGASAAGGASDALRRAGLAWLLEGLMKVIFREADYIHGLQRKMDAHIAAQAANA